MIDELSIGGFVFQSRLILGTGRHRSVEELRNSIEAADAQMVTVTLQYVDLDQVHKRSILQDIEWTGRTILPNTAGCATADEAVRVARLSRSLGLGDFIKLEVVPDKKYLLPDPIETLEAAKVLVKEGFIVMPYMNDDPVLANRLEEAGCAAVMPLAAPIGSGQGMVYLGQIRMIVEQARIPVIVDAGLGVPSDAALAMELGADAVLVNTAIARARDPVQMATAFKLGVQAGRQAFLAGRIPIIGHAIASSSVEGEES